VADAYYQSYRAYQELRSFTPHLVQMRNVLESGRIPSQDRFDEVRASVDRAVADVDHARPTFAIVRHVPFLNRPVEAVRLAADAAEHQTKAAGIVRDILLELLGQSALQTPGSGAQASTSGPSQHGAPVFSNGLVDLQLLDGIIPRLKQVDRDLSAAVASVKAIPTVPFVTISSELRDKAVGEAVRAKALADRTLSVMRLVPSFLGAGSEKTYFVAFQQNAALRGTGGSVLAYALLKVQDGALILDQYGSIYNIDNAFRGFPMRYPKAVQWYVSNAGVNPRIANGANYSPDFPVVADTWMRQVEVATGEHIDGAVAIDPYAMKAILQGAQPIKTEAFPDPITANNVVQAVEHDQFLLSVAQQKAFPAQLIHRAFNLVLLKPPNVADMLRRLSTSLAEKRVQIWTDQSDEQTLLQGLGWDGGLRPVTGDYVNLVQNNRWGNKIDWWGRQKIAYTASIQDDGSVDSTYRVTLTNGIPTPIPDSFDPGLAGRKPLRGIARDMMSLYVPKDATFGSVDPRTVTGPLADEVRPPGFVQHAEDPFDVFTQTITADPQQAVPLTFRYSVPGVIKTTSEGRVYQLTVQHQPLVNPADLTVRVILPDGATPIDAEGWTVKGNVATYHGTLTRDLVLRLVF